MNLRTTLSNTDGCLSTVILLLVKFDIPFIKKKKKSPQVDHYNAPMSVLYSVKGVYPTVGFNVQVTLSALVLAERDVIFKPFILMHT